MKKLALIAGLVTLAACKQAAAPAPEPAATETASPTAAWELTFADGKKGMTVTTGDGKYYYAADLNQSGTYEIVEGEEGKVCFHPEGEDKPVCVTVKQQEDGSYSGTAEDGSTFTSRQIG